MSLKKPKKKTEERQPMHLRLSSQERCQLNRVAARHALSPSATLRFLVQAEDQRAPQNEVVAARYKYPYLWTD